jgi:hypothetical protein
MPLNPGITGITNKSGNEIITRISSSYINTAATISIVRTIMHELIHAHLLHLNYGNPGSDMFQSLLAFASAEGYTDQQELHHEFMPTFIDVISQGFYQWDQANNPGMYSRCSFTRTWLGEDWMEQVHFWPIFPINLIVPEYKTLFNEKHQTTRSRKEHLANY